MSPMTKFLIFALSLFAMAVAVKVVFGTTIGLVAVLIQTVVGTYGGFKIGKGDW